MGTGLASSLCLSRTRQRSALCLPSSKGSPDTSASNATGQEACCCVPSRLITHHRSLRSKSWSGVHMNVTCLSVQQRVCRLLTPPKSALKSCFRNAVLALRGSAEVRGQTDSSLSLDPRHSHGRHTASRAFQHHARVLCRYSEVLVHACRLGRAHAAEGHAVRTGTLKGVFPKSLIQQTQACIPDSALSDQLWVPYGCIMQKPCSYSHGEPGWPPGKLQCSTEWCCFAGMVCRSERIGSHGGEHAALPFLFTA